MQGQLHKKYLGSETKMEFLEDGVKLNFEEYADYINALAALAALRPVTSFQNNPSQEVEA